MYICYLERNDNKENVRDICALTSGSYPAVNAPRDNTGRGVKQGAKGVSYRSECQSIYYQGSTFYYYINEQCAIWDN